MKEDIRSAGSTLMESPTTIYPSRRLLRKLRYPSDLDRLLAHARIYASGKQSVFRTMEKRLQNAIAHRKRGKP